MASRRPGRSEVSMVITSSPLSVSLMAIRVAKACRGTARAPLTSASIDSSPVTSALRTSAIRSHSRSENGGPPPPTRRSQRKSTASPIPEADTRVYACAARISMEWMTSEAAMRDRRPGRSSATTQTTVTLSGRRPQTSRCAGERPRRETMAACSAIADGSKLSRYRWGMDVSKSVWSEEGDGASRMDARIVTRA